MAGAIQFRTRTGQYEPIRLRDGARSSYADLDQRRLLALPATLITLNLATLAWFGIRGTCDVRVKHPIGPDPDAAWPRLLTMARVQTDSDNLATG